MEELDLYVELQSTVCLCGQKKQGGHSFCFKCYRSLQPQMRQHLYRPMGRGYEEAFEAAARRLKIGPFAGSPEPEPQRLAA
jgi:hypothetical protein